MQVFAIICLIILLISIQHLVNWGMRGIWKEVGEDGNLTMTFFLLVVAGVITFYAGRYLILWTYPLIN